MTISLLETVGAGSAFYVLFIHWDGIDKPVLEQIKDGRRLNRADTVSAAVAFEPAAHGSRFPCARIRR
jgi:hypothetical protein